MRKSKGKRGSKLDVDNDPPEYNENSFMANQYEKEKEENARKVKERKYGKAKKKSKVPYKERQKIKFFNTLQKRGINSDKEYHHKTNVKYTQVYKKISQY